MARYEFKEGTSSKFWAIDLSGKSFTVTWGRIGTDGSSQVKKFKSDADAKKEHDKLVAEKTKKGYQLVGGKGAKGGKGKGGTDDGTKAAKAPAAKAARNASLEKAILADPDDADAYLVYADWLQGEGDPRGELITVQAALGKKPKDKKLRDRERELLKEHAATLLGPLAAYQRTMDGDDTPAFTWANGYIRGARLAYDFYAVDALSQRAHEAAGGKGERPKTEIVDLGDVLKALLAHPSGQFLQELTIGIKRHDPDAEYQSVINALVKAAPVTLRTLFVGDFEYPDTIEISWTSLGNFAKLWKAVPRLKKLILQGGSWKLGAIEAPALQHAEFRTGGLAAESIKAIAGAKWPKLERLDAWFGSDHYGFPEKFDVKVLAPLLDGKSVPKLKHLGLMNANFADTLCKLLPKSNLVKQLETLDLSLGTMTDDGALILANARESLGHLQKLTLRENFIGDAAAKKLKGLCKGLEVGEQRQPDVYDDEVNRYVSVGE